MDTINSKKRGIAFGLTSVVFYLGYIEIMLMLGREGTTWFFNSILHGLDVSSITKMHVSLGQATAGIVLVFILGGFGGTLTGMINFGAKFN